MRDGETEVIRQLPSSRLWLLLAAGALSLGMAVLQVSHGQVPWSLAVVVLTFAAAVLGRIPVVIASGQGIRLAGRKFTPWSDVAAIQAPQANGWKHQLPEVVLKDGNRIGLETLTPTQITDIQRLLAQFGSPRGAASEPE